MNANFDASRIEYPESKSDVLYIVNWHNINEYAQLSLQAHEWSESEMEHFVGRKIVARIVNIKIK